jgi:hypothetical protein
MKVKAQGLLNAGRWVERHYGHATLETVLRQCTPADRDRYASAMAIMWHPLEEFVTFLEAAERVTGDPEIAERIGAAAEENLSGIFTKVARYLVSPDFVLRRASSVWSRFNDEGSLQLQELRDDGMLMELLGMPPFRVFCAVLTGWSAEGVAALGAKNPTSDHVECRARGDLRCVWHVRWRKVKA